MRYQVPDCVVEFDDDGHTIWVNSPMGAVLRIKAGEGLKVNPECTNKVIHADIWVKGSVEICVPQRAQAEPQQ